MKFCHYSQNSCPSSLIDSRKTGHSVLVWISHSYRWEGGSCSLQFLGIHNHGSINNQFIIIHTNHTSFNFDNDLNKYTETLVRQKFVSYCIFGLVGKKFIEFYKNLCHFKQAVCNILLKGFKTFIFYEELHITICWTCLVVTL